MITSCLFYNWGNKKMFRSRFSWLSVFFSNTLFRFPSMLFWEGLWHPSVEDCSSGVLVLPRLLFPPMESFGVFFTEVCTTSTAAKGKWWEVTLDCTSTSSAFVFKMEDIERPGILMESALSVRIKCFTICIDVLIYNNWTTLHRLILFAKCWFIGHFLWVI